MAENQGFDLTLQARAEWEARFARARSSRARYVVQGWTGPGGALWQTNTIVRVEDALRGLRRDMLIAGVTFSRSADRGTVTTLDLVLPEAFDLPALREEEDESDPWGAT